MTSYAVEHAKSGRSKCTACKDVIAKDELRCGVEIDIGGHPSTKWRHWKCVTGKVLSNMDDPSALRGFEDLSAEDQELIEATFANPPADKPRAPAAKKQKAGEEAEEGEKKAVVPAKAKGKAKGGRGKGKAAAAKEEEEQEAAAEEGEEEAPAKAKEGRSKRKTAVVKEVEEEEGGAGEGEGGEAEEEEEEAPPPKGKKKAGEAAAATGGTNKGRKKKAAPKAEPEGEGEDWLAD